jgi:hypothetical protein
MALTTFQYFPKLPKGIREAIWATAVRSDHPGVQVFTVYDASVEAEQKLLSEYTLGPPSLGGYALAAPLVGNVGDLDRSDISDSSASPNEQDDQDDQGNQDDQDDRDDQDDQDNSNDSGNSGDGSDGSSNRRIVSWIKGNESTYLIDSGLWSACRESRAMIERRFKVAEWGMMPERNKTWDVDDDGDIPDTQAATWFVVDGESPPIRCLTRPRTDLFYLIFFDYETIDWKRISGLPLSGSPFSTSYGSHSQYRVSHLALESEFHGGWEGKEGQSVVRAASGELSWARNLWFVNYHITRKTGAPPVTYRRDRHQYRRRFYGNGYTFTEVRPYDTDWYADGFEDGGSSVSDFLGRLEIEVFKYCTKRDNAQPPYEPGGYDFRYIGHRPEIGILAREKCAS